MARAWRGFILRMVVQSCAQKMCSGGRGVEDAFQGAVGPMGTENALSHNSLHILNKLTTLLEQFNEYIPPRVDQINITENSTNVEQVGEIAAFIDRANS